MHATRAALALAAALATGFAHAAAAIQATLPLGNQAMVMCFDPVLAEAFVPNFSDGTLTIIDINTLAVAKTIPVGQNPRRIICNAATHRVYLVNTIASGTVTVIDGKTNAVVKVIPVGNRPATLDSNFLIGEIYVSNNGGNTVSVIDTTTETVVATLPVGNAPLLPSSIDVLDKVYVPSSADGTVSVIDASTHAVIKTIAVGNGPQYAAVDGQHRKVYVNNVSDKTVSVIDATTDTVTKILSVGAGTTSNFIVINAVYRRAYLPNATDNTLTIIDTDTDTVVRTLAVGNAPQHVTVDAAGGNVYVVNQDSNSVTIIDAATESVIGSVAVGGAPSRVYDALDYLFVLNSNGAGPDSLTIATEQSTIIGTAIATEFYHAGFNHYFHTADPVETRLLRDGLFGNAWGRTFEFWRVWNVAAAGRAAVCRFFSTSFGARSSHFYTPYPAECSSLQQGSVWQLESTEVFHLILPDPTGSCQPGTAPLYRVYNEGQGGAPNHRYLENRALRTRMVSEGWTAEGSGPDVVFACTPTRIGG